MSGETFGVTAVQRQGKKYHVRGQICYKHLIMPEHYVATQNVNGAAAPCGDSINGSEEKSVI